MLEMSGSVRKLISLKLTNAIMRYEPFNGCDVTSELDGQKIRVQRCRQVCSCCLMVADRGAVRAYTVAPPCGELNSRPTAVAGLL